MKTIKIGINGFGRMGRLVLRSAWGTPGLEFLHINDPCGPAATFAHLLTFDSIHGQWTHQASSSADDEISIAGQSLTFSSNHTIEGTDWSQCDLVIEASGVMKTTEKLQAYLDQGVKRVVVTAPVKEPSVLNVVMGINEDLYQPDQHPIVTAASCTTNCLAPIVKVINDNFGIKHGSITTIHALTNTQTILDTPLPDLRRSRACSMSLIPTTTGSATAIAEIFPKLRGLLNGHAVRVPLTTGSLTDCVFEVDTPATVETINAAFKDASEHQLKDILGYEERPLVSIDYRTDPRSSIVDALSTMVINKTQVKIYAWYDNEWGYANRTAELVKYVADREV